MRDFYFDSVLDIEQSNRQDTAYEQIAQPVVEDVLNGFNGVVMAYGQTGSGKTHTIFGSRASLEHLYSKKGAEQMHSECGIVPRCVDHIFDHIKENPKKAQFRITVSFLEIYMEQITDLLLPTAPGGGSSSSISSNLPTPNHKSSSSHSPIRSGGSQASLGQSTPG